MNKRCFILCIISFAIILEGCEKSFFFEDTDDPGLSRFTNRGYDVMSVYINDYPWVSHFETGGLFVRRSHVSVFKYATQSSEDTLSILWHGAFTNDSIFNNTPWKKYNYVEFLFPVKKEFKLSDFFSWSGTRLPFDATTVDILLHTSFPGASSALSGSGNLYFVDIKPDNRGGIFMSGLFEGKIGDSIAIRKGRFDYNAEVEDHNLQ